MSEYIIADSSHENISSIKSFILKSEQNPKILESISGNDLLSLVLNENPDILLLNLELPGMNGVDVCKEIKDNPFCKHIPIILYGTKSAQLNFSDAIIESGAEAFSTFPIDELSFSLQLRTLLKINASSLSEVNTSGYCKNQEFNSNATIDTIKGLTALEKVEADLFESEKLYKNLVERLPDGVYKSTNRGKFIEVNRAMVEMLGYNSKEELLAIDITKELYFQPEDRESTVLQEKHEEMGTFRLRKKDGTEIWVEDHKWYTLDENGEILFREGVIRDVTQRRKSEKAIADERILLKTLIDNLPDAVYVKDILGRKLISNKADLEILGSTGESNVYGKTDMESSYPGDALQTFKDDMTVIQSAKPILNKLEFFIDHQGAERYFLTNKIPLSNDNGEIIGLVGFGHEVTKEKQTEQKIIQFSKGIEQSPASIIITDISGNIEYVNSKFIETTGFSLDDVKGQSPRILQSGHTPGKEYERLWETVSSGNEYHGEIQNRKKNGELFWESVQISPIRNESNNIISYMAIKEDITSRKKSDLEILKLSVAIEQNPACVVITDTFGVIEYVNKKFVAISGYSKQTLIGTTIRILKPGHTSKHIYADIWNKLLAGNEWKGEHQNRTKSKEIYWESVQISSIRNPEGKITNFIVLSENISERKKMEKELIAAKEKAEESDRLKSAFLANMSHEIRTPLNSILGFSDLLTAPNLDTESRKEYASIICSSGNNLLSIINDIMDISKIEAGQITLIKHEFSANKLISKIQKEYTIKARSKGIEIILKPQTTAQELIIKSDEFRIKQVLINFIGNAIKFTDSGYIEIGVDLVKTSILFHVKDTGIGIPKEFHDKIFDRFRQVEAAHTRKYGGNGLGLAITKNLAELLDGRIWLESEPNVGSTFYFALSENIRII